MRHPWTKRRPMRAAGEPMVLLLAACRRRCTCYRRLPPPRHRRPTTPLPCIHPACSAEEIRAKFERYGPIRDVYLPKDFCEPR